MTPQKSYFFCVIALAIISFFMAYILRHVGLALHDSDACVSLLVSDRFLKDGQFGVFPLTITYGGIAFTYLRALWSQLFQWFTPQDSVRVLGHLYFSYGVTAFLFSYSVFHLAKKIMSCRPAFVSSVTAAVGFSFLLTVIGMDHYSLMLILSPWILYFGIKHHNPFWELKPWPLFFLSLVSGVGVYTFRPVMLVVFATFFPWWPAFDCLSESLRSKRAADLLAKIFFGVLVIFYFLLVVSNGSVGPVFGRTIKLHAQGHLALTFQLLACFLVWRSRRYWDWKPALSRLTLVSLGFIIGFFPELVFMIKNQQGFFNWSESGKLVPLGKVLTAFMELLTGSPTFEAGPLAVVSVIAYFVSMGGLFWSLRQRDVASTRILSLVVLNLLAFLNIKMTLFGATRYLVPMIPALVLSVGLMFEKLASKRWGVAFGIVVATTLVFQVHSRFQIGARSDLIAHQAQIWKIVNTARESGVAFVETDDFWHSLQFSVASSENPAFLPTFASWPFPKYWGEIRESSKGHSIGILKARGLGPGEWKFAVDSL